MKEQNKKKEDKIKELNNKYQFNNKTNTITVKEQVSSKRKFNNITKEEVIRYYIENDINLMKIVCFLMLKMIYYNCNLLRRINIFFF